MKTTLTINLDDRDWYAIAGRAESEGTTVSAIVAAEVTAGLRRVARDAGAKAPRRQPGERSNPYARDVPYRDPLHRDLIRRHWLAGDSSVRIGAIIGTRNLRKVRATLWDLGFDPHASGGRPPAGERRPERALRIIPTTEGETDDRRTA